MPQAENVVTFPANVATTDLLRPFIGSRQARLDEIVGRLSGISAILFLVRNFEGECAEQVLNSALFGAEMLADECIAIAELRPVGVAQ